MMTRADFPAGTRPEAHRGSDTAHGLIRPSPAGDRPAGREIHSAELCFTVKPRPGEELSATFRRLAVALKETEAAILKLIVYGRVDAHASATEVMRGVFGEADWPVTWVEGAPCHESPIAGMQVFALSGGDVQRIEMDGRVVGSVFESGGARQFLSGGLGPDARDASRPEQTRQTLDRLERALDQANFSLADVVRTWFFLEDLLSWYDAFNQARTGVYSRTRFRSGSMPASTGVAGRNPAGAGLTVGAWAWRPIDGSARAEEIASPLQCPAPAYGSSFSRAMELSSAIGRRLLISGTASIAADGRSVWMGDARMQIRHTMKVVQAILDSRGFKPSDATRATAYFKNPADLSIFAEWCVENDVHSLPVVAVHCDICRDDLLFEVELDGWKKG
jgi:enamine deaminase RidA (YjgF/YER057c/UK114 family)